MKQQKLKKCPLCGEIPDIYQDEAYGPGGPIPTDWVIWCKCGLKLENTSESKLIKHWNTRKEIVNDMDT